MALGTPGFLPPTPAEKCLALEKMTGSGKNDTGSSKKFQFWQI